MKQHFLISGLEDGAYEAQLLKALGKVEAIKHFEIDFTHSLLYIESKKRISLERLQKAFSKEGLTYKLSYAFHDNSVKKVSHWRIKGKQNRLHNSQSLYYCPMHCEGDKSYTQAGSCPVCGMDLIEEFRETALSEYTCPMHGQIIMDEAGDCPICGMPLVAKEPESSREERTYLQLSAKMRVAIFFALAVFLISMGEMLPHDPLGTILTQKYWNWLQFLLTIPVVIVCRMFFSRAYHSIITWKLNMFTLVGLGTGVAFVFSIMGLCLPDLFPDQFKAADGSVHLYFEATAVILTLVLLGQLLEAKAHSKTSGAIKALLGLSPSYTTRIVQGRDTKVAIYDVKVGDLLRVKPGEKVPVDGHIIEGSSRIDESMISGEPMPVEKHIGDMVRAGTINGMQVFVMSAQKVGSDTLLAQIIEMVNTASRSRAPIQKLADTIAGYFVPTIIVIALMTFAVWAMFGPEPAFVYGFVNAIAVLIISCPCALGLATPMSVMVGVGKGAQSGILIKNAQALETLEKVDVIIIDKTGTITEGKPSVDHLVCNAPIQKKEMLRLAASLSSYSAHPLSEAIVGYAKTSLASLDEVENFTAFSGKGISGLIFNQRICLGNEKFMKEQDISIDPALEAESEAEQKAAKTVSYIARDKKILGFITISDAIKAHSREAIAELMEQGIEVLMMTGDNDHTARAISKELGLKDYRSQCLPEDKLERVKQLQERGKVVAMTGDGINDAPALAQANIGIAMGTGSDIAMESAQMTLVDGDLLGIVKAVRLSKAVIKNIKQNLFFAFIYNALGVPIAAGVLYPVFGILLSPMIAAAAMSFSSVSVISNALRLRSINLHKR